MPSPSHRPQGSFSPGSPSAALRRGDIKISDPISLEPRGDTSPRSRYTTQSLYGSGSRAKDSRWMQKYPITPDSHARHTSDVQLYTGARSFSGPSFLPRSMSSVPSKASLDQKRPAGFRAVLRRLFSSRRHRSAPAASSGYQYCSHRHLTSVAEQQTHIEHDQAPGSEALLREAALGPHTTHQQRNVHEQGVANVPRRRRRNTLPSLVFSENEPGLVDAIINRSTGMVPSQTQWLNEDHISDHQLNRRSRSAGALNELLRREHFELSSVRDRAGEIAYWRNSATEHPVPVYSGQSIRVEAGHTPGPVVSRPASNGMGSPVTPMQSFEFGLEDQNINETNLEQRVNTLEIKLFDFEYAIAKLQGNNIPKPLTHPQVFIPAPAADLLLEGHKHPDPSVGPSHLPSPAMRHAYTILPAPSVSPPPSPEEGNLSLLPRASQATTATVRPSTASRRSAIRLSETSPSSAQKSADKFEVLMGLIQDERAARQKLEAQVMELQKELEGMRTPIYATIREAYPTPSPESTHIAIGTPRNLHRAPGFQLSHAVKEISRFSETDTETDADEGSQDVFGTPQESRNTFESARGSLESAII